MSFVKPVLHLYNWSVLKVKDEDTDLSRAIKSRILEYLNETYSDPQIQALLDMASTVDPHFKMSYTAEDNKTSIQARMNSEIKTVAVTVIEKKQVLHSDLDSDLRLLNLIVSFYVCRCLPQNHQKKTLRRMLKLDALQRKR